MSPSPLLTWLCAVLMAAAASAGTDGGHTNMAAFGRGLKVSGDELTGACRGHPSDPSFYRRWRAGGDDGGSPPAAAEPPPEATASAAVPSAPADGDTASAAPRAPVPSHEQQSGPMLRVAFQGERGAYSEKATRELLLGKAGAARAGFGAGLTAVGRPDFDACFRAVSSRECDYACLPFENSLGGSIHENFDLMLRYDLVIVGEYELRVSHNLLSNAESIDDIKYAISHPQALAQCANYLRARNITPLPVYDTAGAAKMLSEGQGLPSGCTQHNTAAIASDLAGAVYRVKVLQAAIEDDDSNFTRFLLLGRQGVGKLLPSDVPAKTSVVFTLPEASGALYKALACFSLRDINLSKMESRPTSASLLQFLKFRSSADGGEGGSEDVPRFRYCFYVDFLAGELEQRAQNALHHLREQSDFCRILGSYPQKSRLVGPVKAAVDRIRQAPITESGADTVTSLPSDDRDAGPLKIGIVGYGRFGQFLGRTMERSHTVSCLDKVDKSEIAKKNGVKFFSPLDVRTFANDLDVILFAVPIIEFEEAVQFFPTDLLRHKLIVEVCSLKSHAKQVLLRDLPPDCDVLCCHPMFGPNCSFGRAWEGLPAVYERVRLSDIGRADRFLDIFGSERCRMVEMTSEQHDEATTDAEFVTHLIGRLLGQRARPATPVASEGYRSLLEIVDMCSSDSFDLFYGMFAHNRANAGRLLTGMRNSLAELESRLAAKEAYLDARAEMKRGDRRALLAECKALLREVAESGNGGSGRAEGDKGDEGAATAAAE